MKRGTTAKITVKLPDIYKLSEIDSAVLTICQPEFDVFITKQLADLSQNILDNSFSVSLSQAESLQFNFGVASVQIKIKIGASVIASQIGKIAINNILSEVIL